MKNTICVIAAMLCLQICIGAPDPKIQRPLRLEKLYMFINVDPCMDAYNAGAATNELWFNFAVSYCYEVYQFPYNTSCHSQAIRSWSEEQDYLFNQLVICQNGNPAKNKKDIKSKQ